MKAVQNDPHSIQESIAAELNVQPRPGLHGIAGTRTEIEKVRKIQAVPRHTEYNDLQDTLENRAKIRATIQDIRELNRDNRNLRYQIRMHSNSGRLQVALVNYRTGETIEEIPSSKLLDFNAELEKFNGLVLEEKA